MDCEIGQAYAWVREKEDGSWEVKAVVRRSAEEVARHREAIAKAIGKMPAVVEKFREAGGGCIGADCAGRRCGIFAS